MRILCDSFLKLYLAGETREGRLTEVARAEKKGETHPAVSLSSAKTFRTSQ